MARYSETFVIHGNQQLIEDSIHQYLEAEGYHIDLYKQQEVYRKGNGFVSGPSFVRIAYSEGYLILSAWIKFALLPGVFMGEMGITGFFGSLPKKKLKRRVDHIIEIIYATEEQYATLSNF